MCRITAIMGEYSGRQEFLLAFRELAVTGKVSVKSKPKSGHRDGWGLICYDGSPKYLGRSPEDASSDEGYRAACDSLAGVHHPTIVMAHLRKASFGVRSLENTQPFLRGKWSFAHNGTIYSPKFREGDAASDTAVLFDRLMIAIENKDPSASPESTILETVRNIRNEIMNNPDDSGKTYSSLTFLMSNGVSLYALRDFASQSDTDYYTLHYLHVDHAMILCQEQIIPGEWKSIPNKSLATVDSQSNIQIRSCDS
jgi:predicted glutamine amidotransferase